MILKFGRSVSPRLINCLSAAIIAAASLVTVDALAESQPGRPAPGEKPSAERVRSPIKLLQNGTYRPAVPPRLSGRARVRPLTPKDKMTFFGTETGAPYLTLDITTPVVAGKGSLIYIAPSYVEPAFGELYYLPNQGDFIVSLKVEANKFYFVDVLYAPASPHGTCFGFTVTWPDKSKDEMTCHLAGTYVQHLLLAFKAPGTGTYYVSIGPKQYTQFYQVEVTAK